MGQNGPPFGWAYNPPVKQISLALTAAAALGAAALAAQPQGRPFDLLVTNARIVDGTGAPSVTGSVAVRDGRMSASAV